MNLIAIFFLLISAISFGQNPVTSAELVYGPQNSACVRDLDSVYAPNANQNPKLYFCDCAKPSWATPNANCVAGNDNNLGLTPNTPKRTLNHLGDVLSQVPAGTTIALCRGGVFNDQRLVVTNRTQTNCKANNRCVIRDYLPPQYQSDPGLPILSQGIFLSNTKKHVEGFLFENLKIVGPGQLISNSDGIYISNDISDVMFHRVDIGGFATGFHFAGGQGLHTPNFSLRCSNVHDNYNQGLLGTDNNLVIELNYFYNNGFAYPILGHHIYLNNPDKLPTSNVVIRQNELYKAAIAQSAGSGFGTTWEANKCASVSLAGHGNAGLYSNYLIQNNYVHEDLNKANPSCYGIALGHGNEDSAWAQVLIDGNKVENLGGAGILLESCTNCTISNNAVSSNQTVPTNAIAFASGPMAASGNRVLYNSIFLNNPGNGSSAIYYNNQSKNNAIVGNALSYSGNNRFTALNVNLSNSQFYSIDFNMFLSSAWVGIPQTLSLAQWQAMGWDLHSTQKNPQYWKFSNLSPLTTSPMLAAGETAWCPFTDLLGLPRSKSSPCTVGAYQYYVNLP